MAISIETRKIDRGKVTQKIFEQKTQIIDNNWSNSIA